MLLTFVNNQSLTHNPMAIKTLSNYELVIGEHTILVNIDLQLKEDSFEHEFGTEDASSWEFLSCELSSDEDSQLFNFDYITEMVEETLDVTQYLN
jgi:hypothetical protein